MKKEEPWDLSINRDAASTSTPRKRTPKKAVKDEGNDDDHEDLDGTPSKKKTPLNKVQNGRVTKKKGGAGTAASAAILIKDEDFETSYEAHENVDYNPSNYNLQGYDQEQALDQANGYYAQVENDDDEA